MFRIIKPIKDVWHITVKHNGLASWYRGGRHKGIDLRTRCSAYPNGIGTPIYAVADGVWEKSDYNYFMGNKVVLRHGRYQSVYGHLSKSSFKKGYKAVKAGDIIGYSGNTGKLSFGAHLHFEIIKDGKSLDPEVFIKNGENLVKWAKSRAIMKVQDGGKLKFLIKGGIVDLNKENCWDIISKNSWGITDSDYKDLLNLL